MGKNKWILLATILASGMAFFDGSTTGVALPTIQNYFHASITQIQWVVNAFALTLASLLMLSGSLGDKFGRKKIFNSGIILFVIGSILSALSKSAAQLIIFQALQGLGAAMMIPGSLAIINTCFEENIRGKAIGLWAGYSGGLAASGPFLGGWLTQTFGWQSTWWINVPFGAAALFMSIKFVPESKNPDAKKLDWLGAFLLAAGLLDVAYGLMTAPVSGWRHVRTLGALISGLIILSAFVYNQFKTKNSLVPLQIFKLPLVSGANLVTLFVYFSLYGLFFFQMLNFQQVQGYTPAIAGLATLPSVVLITFLSGPAGGLSDKIGPRVQMILGPSLVAAGMLIFMVPGVKANYFVTFFLGQIAVGAGMCLLIAPLTKSALAVPHQFSGAASGVNNAISRIAAMLAVAVLGVIVFSAFSSSLAQKLQNSSLSQQQKQQVIAQQNKLSGIELPAGFPEEAKEIVKTSFVRAFRLTMGINAGLCVLAALVAAATIKNKPA